MYPARPYSGRLRDVLRAVHMTDQALPFPDLDARMVRVPKKRFGLHASRSIVDGGQYGH